jgi:hypothetical protein
MEAAAAGEGQVDANVVHLRGLAVMSFQALDECFDDTIAHDTEAGPGATRSGAQGHALRPC